MYDCDVTVTDHVGVASEEADDAVWHDATHLHQQVAIVTNHRCNIHAI